MHVRDLLYAPYSSTNVEYRLQWCAHCGLTPGLWSCLDKRRRGDAGCLGVYANLVDFIEVLLWSLRLRLFYFRILMQWMLHEAIVGFVRAELFCCCSAMLPHDHFLYCALCHLKKAKEIMENSFLAINSLHSSFFILRGLSEKEISLILMCKSWSKQSRNPSATKELFFARFLCPINE